MVLVASRHSARGSGARGANQKNVPLDRVPLAGSTPLKGRQPDSYKRQSGRRRTANSEASPNQANYRTALYSPAEVAAQGRPRERSPEPLVLARFWLLLPRGKSNRRASGGVQPPGFRTETSAGGPAGAAEPRQLNRTYFAVFAGVTSNLYPTPQTVFNAHWSETSSTFSLRRLICTSTVRLSPK